MYFPNLIFIILSNLKGKYPAFLKNTHQQMLATIQLEGKNPQTSEHYACYKLHGR